ncbi:MAG: hypothetical protein HOP09_12830 [Hyphomicrobium sp.]|nr:hypothetical protein [Hyphomicrobium sp.]
MSLKSRWYCGLALAAAACMFGLAGAADAANKKHPIMKGGKPFVLSGAAVIHDIVRIGGRVCFDRHVHYGSSMGQSNVKAAQAAAVSSWYELVQLEYGSQWSSYQLAAGKDVKCSQSGAGWGCEVHATPCSR